MYIHGVALTSFSPLDGGNFVEKEREPSILWLSTVKKYFAKLTGRVVIVS